MPPGDYSLGGYANLVRDLLAVIGEERGTIVGHSLGGGVAMQFAYQFPERCERIVLVSSGGLGREAGAAVAEHRRRPEHLDGGERRPASWRAGGSSSPRRGTLSLCRGSWALRRRPIRAARRFSHCDARHACADSVEPGTFRYPRSFVIHSGRRGRSPVKPRTGGRWRPQLRSSTQDALLSRDGGPEDPFVGRRHYCRRRFGSDEELE